MKNVILVLFITFSFVKTYGQAAVEDVVFDLQIYGGGYNVQCHGGMVDIEPTFIGAAYPFTCTWYNDTGAVVSQSANLMGVSVGLGRYTLEITKGSWTNNYDVYLIEPEQIVLSLNAEDYNGYDISEHGGHDGSVNSQIEGGISPYKYLWSNGSTLENLNSLYAGTYSLTITDAGGCTKSQSITLIEPTRLQVSSISSPALHGYNVSRHGGHNGAVNLNVTGGTPPYTYYWSSGDTTKDIDTVLTAHLYSVIITDNNNASIIKSITLTEPAELSVTLSPSVYGDFNLSCHDCNNGSITANVMGGVQPYTYVWSNSLTTQTISNLSARDYSVTVRDAHGASIAREINLRAPDRDDWSMSGNANTTSSQFIGTTDNKDLVLKTNNAVRVTIKNNGDAQFQGSLKINNMSGTGNRSVYADSSGKLLRSPDPTTSACDNLMPATWNIPTSNNDDAVRCVGKVGIGVLQPLEKLHIVGGTRWNEPNNTTEYLTIKNIYGTYRINSYGTKLFINDDSHENINLCNNGGVVSIGQVTPSGNFKLFVRGGIRTESIKVDVANGIWADYVFDEKYKLRSLADLEAYIKIHKHLPGIPSATELVESGVDLLEMDAKLLAKIEEQALYIIDQDKRIIELDKRIEKLEKKKK